MVRTRTSARRGDASRRRMVVRSRAASRRRGGRVVRSRRRRGRRATKCERGGGMSKRDLKRIQKDVSELQAAGENIQNDTDDFLPLSWTIDGPEGTQYEKNQYELRIDFPDNYPFSEPKIKFVTPIEHSNVESNKFGKRGPYKLIQTLYGDSWEPRITLMDMKNKLLKLLGES